tara:strand:- start:99 stop:392 length:294 start_codon:yes stop_codon:yes gene_type:complete
MGMNPTAERVAFGIASWIIGASIIGFVIYITVVPLMDLFVFFLYWLLPLAAIGMGLGLVSAGTLQTIRAFLTSEGMSQRIRKYVRILREDPEAQPAT